MSEAYFIEIINKHQGIIHKICRLYRTGKEDQEDLFQEIVYQAFKSFPDFEGKSKITTWLYRIALNTAMSSFRKKAPQIVYTEALPDYAAESIEKDVQREQLFNALTRLSDSEKAIIALYLENLSYAQIAEITGVNENNIGVKLNRIKAKIQKLLNH